MVALRAQRRRIPRPYVARLTVWQLRRLRALLTTRPRPRRPRQTWTIRTVERFDDRIDRFCEQAAQQFDLILDRNQDYLNWRYCDRRAGPFTVRLAEQDGETVGYAVIRRSDEVGLFADLLTLPGRSDVAASLVDDAIDQSRANGALAIRTSMLRNHPYNPILKAAGFFPTTNLGEITYTDYTPDGALSFLQDPQAKVHFVMGDSDGI